MSTYINIPKTKEEITLDWFNLIFNQQNKTVYNLTWLGEANNGKGVLSSLTRVRLEIVDSSYPDLLTELFVIIKMLPSDQKIRDFVVTGGYSSREVNMYTKVFPDMDKFMNDKELPSYFKFRHPKCYFGADEYDENNYNMILVLEDMSASNYIGWEEAVLTEGKWGNNNLLDKKYALAALQQIAFFHAVTFAYRSVHDISNYLDIYPFLYNSSIYDPMVKEYSDIGYNTICEILKKFDSLPMDLLKKLEEQKEEVPKMLMMTSTSNLTSSSGIISTLCHFDLHKYNVMFSYEGDAVEASWLDYQTCQERPAVCDVSFFLLLSYGSALFSNDLTNMLEFYHKSFSEVLDKLQINIFYPFKKFEEDFQNSVAVSIWRIICGATVWFENPESHNRLKELICEVYESGLLEKKL